MNRSIPYSTILTAALCLLTACTDDLPTGSAARRQPGLVAELTQDWDQPAATRSQRTAASANDGWMTQAEGMVGGQPVYLYATEVEGISGLQLPARVPAAKGDATRGVLYGTASNRFHSSFSVYALGLMPAGGRVVSPDATTADPELATWYLDKPLEWADDLPVTFYALAPHATYSGVTAASPVLSYDNPDEALKQEDLMAAVTTGKRSDTEIRFPFKHVLSAIKFKIGHKGLANPHNNTKIKQIVISGIYKKGSYDIANDSWTLNTGVKGLVKQADDWAGFSLKDKSIGANLMVTSDVGGTTFLVVPQVIPAGATATITIEENGVSQNITAALSGEWRQGHTITYSITSSNDYPGYVFEVETTGTTLTYDHTGKPVGSNEFVVRSYLNDDSKTPAPWSIDGYANGSDPWSTTNSTFAHSFKVDDRDGETSGSGGQAGETVRIPTVDAKEKTVVHEDYRRASALAARTEVTERMDLSLYQVDNATLWPGGRNSANSYIVRQAGLYKIPVAAGNSILNGALYSYMGVGNGNFVNYKNQPMTNRPDNYLLKTAVRAEILWQDVSGLVSVETAIRTAELTIGSETVNYVYFSVPQANIRQGNAVIVLKDSSGNIVWSYHIYVTDSDWTQTVSCQAQDTDPEYHFAPEYLGYVEHTYRHLRYDERTMRLRITQTTTGLASTVNIIQQEGEVFERLPFAVHFQFGRKDAFPGMEPYYSTPKVEGRYAQMTISDAIKFPLRMTIGDSRSDWMKYPSGGDPSWPNLTNLWSAANVKDADNSTTPYNDDAVLKTIYDPSPAGFHVPPSNAFLFTTKANKSSTVIDSKGEDYYLLQTLATDAANWNALTDSKYDPAMINGHVFYTRSNSTSSTPTIYLPFCGRRYAGSAVLSGLTHLLPGSNGYGGFLWCATPYHQGRSTGSNPSTRPASGCLFSMFREQVNSRANGDVIYKPGKDYNYRTGGLCILPVKDVEAGIY